jgi:DinB superfamily
MRDLEVMATTVRVRRTCSELNPTLENFDGDAVARAANYNAEELSEALGTLTAARRTTIATLRELGAEALLRRVTFAGEPTTLAGVLRLLRAHDAEHVEAIRELAAGLRGAATAAAPIGS